MIYDPNRLLDDDKQRLIALSDDLGISPISAMISLVYLWQWSLQNSIDGKLGVLDNATLAKHSRWDPDNGVGSWARALKQTGSGDGFITVAENGILQLTNPERVNSYMFDIYSELSMQAGKAVLNIR